MIEDFQVRNKKAEEALREMGEALKTITPPGMGFTVMLFDYGDGGNMFYISSAERSDMIKAMEEFLEKQK